MLRKDFNVDYDDAGSIGKRYRREDEIGTPYCITIDFDTMDNDTVTIRDRDTMKQFRVKIDELKDFMKEKYSFSRCIMLILLPLLRGSEISMILFLFIVNIYHKLF